MDSVIDSKSFPVVHSMLADSDVLKTIRLLCVFGCNGEEVIYITKEDQVYGYGRNRFGGLGLGHCDDNVRRTQLNTTLSDKQIVDIFCGYEHWSALTADGKCYMWGHNEFGQLGIGSIVSTATPQLVEELTDKTVVQLSCGATHTLALTSEGQVYSWGSNKSGQLGNGYKGFLANPRKLSFKETVTAICCGKNHCIALTAKGKAYLWGLNNYGQLGQSMNGMIGYSPRMVSNIKSTIFTKAICGPNYSLLLTSNGCLYAFGDNSCGQIGIGSMDNQFIPTRVCADMKFVDIVAHKENDVSIAFTEDNKHFVWGLAKNRRYLTPKEITDSSGLSVFDIYAKYAKTKVTFKTIVLNENMNYLERNQFTHELNNNKNKSNKVFNKMDDNSGNCRQTEPKPNHSRNLKTLDQMMDTKNFPILYSTLTDERMRNSIRLLRVFGVKGCKVIFITNADRVYAFGLNRDGSLGLGSYEEHIRKPQLSEVLSNKEIIDIAPGFEHCLALTASGQCYAWGQNRYGQLGNKSVANECTPQLIEELTDVKVVQIYCGAYHSMALSSDGEVFSWGHNTFAQLGDRTYNSRDIPTQVLITEKITFISCGANHSMALSECGRVYVWGNNSFGQLGRDPAKDVQKGRLKPMSSRPRALQSITNIRKAICGPNHSLLLTTDGSVYAFGINTDGQVGNGSLDNQYDPVKLNPNNNIKIKDIITFYDNHISVAVSESNHCFVWGMVWGLNRVTKPKLVPESSENLIDIYGKYSTSKTFYKTIVVNELYQISRCGLRFEELEEPNPKTLISNQLFSSNVSKIISPFDDFEEFKTFDEEINIRLFPILSPTFDDNLRTNIRLLYVFGTNGSNVIFATNEDMVYGYGNNCDGFLGVGTFEHHIKSPVLNQVLTGKQLIEVRNGFAHCIGLTSSGQCYAWGQNKYGQLGNGTQKASNCSQLIQRIADKKVTQIACGGYFSLALTSEGQLYSWGQNILGQLGISTYYNTPVPNLIDVKHPIISISCGRNHSSAVADIGMVYTWGHNEFCQLGREKEFDYRPNRKQWIAFRPFYNSYFKNITFVKAVCGANYTLILTDDGFIYAFGDNSNGQVGNGKHGLQSRPIRINDKIRFKDIITHFDNDLSIGVSTDDEYYIWGLADHKKILSPELIPESREESAFNIYGFYASKKITFKTLVINKELTQSKESSKLQYKHKKNVFLDGLSKNVKEEIQSDNNLNNANDYPCTPPPSPPKRLKFEDKISNNLSNNEKNELFNNPNTSDLKIMSENETIYGNKAFLKTRNRKFWEVLNHKSDGQNKNEVRINREKFDVFYAFLQYLYGIEPQFNEKIIFDLQSMAHHFDEVELLDICTKFIRNLDSKPNINTVCSLYGKAINEGLPDLEKTCVEFAVNNWKTILKSNEFLSMDDSLSKRLIISVFDLK